MSAAQVGERQPLLPQHVQPSSSSNVVSTVNVASLPWIQLRGACLGLGISLKLVSVLLGIAMCVYTRHHSAAFINADGSNNSKSSDTPYIYAYFGVGVAFALLGPTSLYACNSNFSVFFAVTLYFAYLFFAFYSIACAAWDEVWVVFNLIVVTFVLDLAWLGCICLCFCR